MESLFIRVDASTQIGTGHLMRCLALAQAWKDADGRVTFITAYQVDGLLRRIREEGFELHVLSSAYPDASDWVNTSGIMATDINAWVVLDGYHFDEVYQQQVKDAGHRLLVIDDMAHLKRYYADIVLNQNLHVGQLHYSCEPYTRLLLGTQYVLLRREFLGWRDWKRQIPKVARKVLVTLGGSDLGNHTLKVIQTLQKIDETDLDVIVVVGASNPHTNELESAIRQSRIPIRLIHNVQNVPELMAWADMAISAGGVTCWELGYMGVPMLVVVMASNQEANAEVLEERGAAIALNLENTRDLTRMGQLIQELLSNRQARVAMGQSGRALVDGKGIERLFGVINHAMTREKIES